MPLTVAHHVAVVSAAGTGRSSGTTHPRSQPGRGHKLWDTTLLRFLTRGPVDRVGRVVALTRTGATDCSSTVAVVFSAGTGRSTGATRVSQADQSYKLWNSTMQWFLLRDRVGRAHLGDQPFVVGSMLQIVALHVAAIFDKNGVDRVGQPAIHRWTGATHCNTLPAAAATAAATDDFSQYSNSNFLQARCGK